MIGLSSVLAAGIQRGLPGSLEHRLDLGQVVSADLDTQVPCCLRQVEMTGHDLVHVIRLHSSPLALALSQELAIRVAAIRYSQQGAEGVKEYEFYGQHHLKSVSTQPGTNRH